MENRVDDASAVQQQSASYVQTMAYSNRADSADLGGLKGKISQDTQAAQYADALKRQSGGKLSDTDALNAASSAVKKANS